MATDPLNLKPGPKKAGPRQIDADHEAGRAASLARQNRLQARSQVVVAILVVLTACYVAKLILVVLLVAILLVFILAPLVELLERIRVPRAVGSLLAIVLVMGAIAGATYFGANKATDFIQELPRYSGKIRVVIGKMRQRTEKIQRATQQITGGRQPQQPQQSQAPNWTSIISDNLGSVTEVIFAASFIPFLAYFMLTWQAHVRAASVKLFQAENRNTAYVTMGMISSMIRSYIVGNLLVGLFMGGVSTIVFAFLHVPYFYFVGFIAGFVNLVPYLGVLLAPAAPLVAGMGHIHSMQAIVIVVLEVALHLFSLNVLYPKFIGSRLQLNPLSVTVALLFWGWLWGAVGLILAIPITAAFKIACDNVGPLRAYGEWLGEGSNY